MSFVFENFWPVHSIAWFVFAAVGATSGYFLANVTQSILLNTLILLGIMFGMSFAVAQAIGMALALQPQHFASWASFTDFWFESQDMVWMYNGRLFEVLWSTGIGTGVCIVFGVIMLFAGKERV